MAMTPEGKVKKKVKLLLAGWGDRVYQFWPVQSGFGSATLDLLGCANGHFFALETKRAKEDLTDRQHLVRVLMDRANAKVFRVRDDAELKAFEQWLRWVAGPPSNDNLAR